MRGWGVLGGLLALVVVASAGPVLAQEVTPIIYNTSVQGTITDTQFATTYVFEGRAGDTIRVEMTAVSGDLDPLLELWDSAGTLLMTNDDISESDRNSRLDAYTLPASASYRLRATRYNVTDGITTGAYRLTLTLLDTAGAEGEPPRPALDVAYEQIGYNETLSGQLDGTGPRYYLFSADAGDVVVAVMTPTTVGVVPSVRFYDADLGEISPSVPKDDGTAAAYYVVTAPGWYLIGVDSLGSAGTYRLETIAFPALWITYGDFVSGQVTADAPNNWYVFRAHYGDTVSIEMAAGGGDLVPYVILADKALNDLAYSPVGPNPATLTYTIPRTDTYVILASRENLAEGTTTGPFGLTVNGMPLDPYTLRAPPLGYGRSAVGTISDDNPVAIYSFQAKAGDLVTIRMTAHELAQLDPYLILADSAFEELAVSDDTGTSSDARIFQYQLSAAGTYYILATRPRLALGEGSGGFTLELVAGPVPLTTGAVEATIRWDSTADVDLFVRDPQGEVVGWDSPTSPSGGLLEVDTNANCQSLTALPVEHIYWPEGTGLPGIYAIFVWYQMDCENTGPLRFSLTVSVGGREIARVEEQLARGQRYEMSITVGEDGSAHSNNDGTITSPDVSKSIPITYGEAVTGVINADHPFVDYVFSGEAGETVVVTMDRVDGDLDPYLALLDAADEVLIEDDDGGGDRNARLTYTLSATGTYTIVATRYEFRDGTTAGQYRLALTRSN